MDGYVISYNDNEGGSFEQLVDGGTHNSVVANLTKGHTYNITVFSYKDLPSPPSETVLIKIDGECKDIYPPTVLIFTTVPDQITVKLLPTTSVLTLALNSDSSVQYTNYTISYYSNSCPDINTTSVTVPAQQTHYSKTLRSGQTYDITITATNLIGTSLPVSLKYSVPVYEGKQ